MLSEEFIGSINADGIRLYWPQANIFLCGGKRSAVNDPDYETRMRSLRDACLRERFSKNISRANFLIAEEMSEIFNLDSPYGNWVDFETDLAQISQIVLLMAESTGSFVELGAFSIIREIREKLFVVVRSGHLERGGFIANGIKPYLDRHQPGSVFALEDDFVGIRDDDFSKVDPEKLSAVLSGHINNRIKEISSRGSSSLVVNDFSHACRFFVALIHELCFATLNELREIMECFYFNFEIISLKKVAFCCTVVGWVGKVSCAFDDVYFPHERKIEVSPAKFSFSGKLADPLRRKTHFRSLAEKHFPDRVAAVNRVTRNV